MTTITTRTGTYYDEALQTRAFRLLPAEYRVTDQPLALVTLLVPSYTREGKAYLTIAFGCTGGRHRSVFAAELAANHLKNCGLSPTIVHRDMKGHSDGAELAGGPATANTTESEYL